MSSPPILTASVHEHFLEVIEESLQLHQLSANMHLKDYLVDLLCGFAWQPTGIFDEPLGPVLVRAQSGQPKRQLKALKKVGDRALYVSGFFRERIARKQLSPNYYSDIGESAYRRLSRLVRGRSGSADQAEIYAQLAADFEEFVKIFREVKNHGKATSQDLGDCFEIWQKTGSLRARRQLEQAGISVVTYRKNSKN